MGTADGVLAARVLDLLPRFFMASGPCPPGGMPGATDPAGGSAAHGEGLECPPFSGTPPTPLQMRAALHLARTGGLTVGDLASALGLSLSRASRIADELERDGMLSRERDPHDRRIVRLCPSDWATAMGQRLLDHQAGAVERALDRTPPVDRAGAVSFLERLVEEFERRADAPRAQP